MSDERLSRLIGMIYEAALQPDLWGDVLAEVAATAPCAEVAVYSHDSAARTAVFHHSYGHDPFYVQQYIDRWAATDPIAKALVALAPGEVSGLAGIMDYDAFTRHPFYIEWGRPQRYCDCINIILERTPTRISSVSLLRNDDHGPADEESLERARLLAPHFLRSIRMGRALEDSTLKAETLSATLDRLASPVLVIRGDNALVHANKPALELMSNGLTLDRIAAALRGAGINGAARAIPADRTFVIATNGTDRCLCHAMPLKLNGSLLHGAPSLTLLVIQSALSTDAAVADAAQLFGLTAREREVLFGVVEVGGGPEIAAMLGISRATVQTHLKALFSKTQTRRQADLVGLVSGLISPFRRSG